MQLCHITITKTGEIAHQFRLFCFTNSPNLQRNFAQIELHTHIFL